MITYYKQAMNFVDEQFETLTPAQQETFIFAVSTYGFNETTCDKWAYYWFGMTFKQFMEE